MGQLPNISLDDKYTASSGSVYVTGVQALVRLPIMQHARDLADGLDTACYISGYRGSPLGGLDGQFAKARSFIDKHNIYFQPGINEELAATAIWGSQQAEIDGKGKYDGVFALWYGKGPGVDRSGDAFRHGNLAGSSRHGGVLVLMGDDHTCESSTTCHQSEFALVDAQMPILSPAGLDELLAFGLLGWSLSRYSGCWVGLKCVKDTVEASGIVDLDALSEPARTPNDFPLPAEGLNIRQPDSPQAQEARLAGIKLEAAKAFARANAIDRVVLGDPSTARIGIVTAGKSWLDLRQALADLGIDEAAARRLRLAVFKVGMVWPLEPQVISQFARGKDQVIVIEEKRSLIESQLKELLYRQPDAPAIIGKKDETGAELFAATMALDASQIGLEVGRRLADLNDDAALRDTVTALSGRKRAKDGQDILARSFYFCAGCPHSTSTKVPEGSAAYAGIGCAWMAQTMDRQTLGFTQMGGEGLSWAGEAPFSNKAHMFQNMGDGTYFHSGYLAIRAAVAAGTNITFKILFNDAVAMTGGQAHDGSLDPARISRQVAAEGVMRVVVVSDDPGRYAADTPWAPGVTVYHRSKLDQVQRQLREIAGTTVLIYDQTCAAEKRRRRKRGRFPDPDMRLLINELVCEGCGDCGVQSNCVAVTPLETEYGRKRAIDQSACNKDFSCLNGFCPSFVTVRGGEIRRAKPAGAESATDLLEPSQPNLAGGVYSMVVTGVGGTGVVTIGALLGVAAHLEGKGVGILDMAGLAQKGGSVWTHIRFGKTADDIAAVRVAPGGADFLLGCDLVVAASEKTLELLRPEGRAIINRREVMPGQFARNPDLKFPGRELLEKLKSAIGSERLEVFDATGRALELCGDTIAANLFMLGVACQRGLVPVGPDAIERAIELNGTAVTMNLAAFRGGRRYAVTRRRIEDGLPDHLDHRRPSTSIAEVVDRRVQFLTAYQSVKYARRFQVMVDRVAAREKALAPGSTVLAAAVARSFFKLLAYKDEYEVARLFSADAFKVQLAEAFEGNPKIAFNLAPPIFPGRAADGRPVKREFGAWMIPLFGFLAKLRFLRGTPFDPFGRTEERKMERAMIIEFETLMDRLLGEATREKLDLLVEIAAAPQAVRGFGPVKLAAVERFRSEMSILLAKWNGSDLDSLPHPVSAEVVAASA